MGSMADDRTDMDNNGNRKYDALPAENECFGKGYPRCVK